MLIIWSEGRVYIDELQAHGQQARAAMFCRYYKAVSKHLSKHLSKHSPRSLRWQSQCTSLNSIISSGLLAWKVALCHS